MKRRISAALCGCVWAAAAHTGCHATGVARACWTWDPPVGRISPLQLLMKAGQMRERSSSCQEGKAAQLTGTKPPSSLRGAVSRMDCSDGTRKGCSDMSGPDGVV